MPITSFSGTAGFAVLLEKRNNGIANITDRVATMCTRIQLFRILLPYVFCLLLSVAVASVSGVLVTLYIIILGFCRFAEPTNLIRFECKLLTGFSSRNNISLLPRFLRHTRHRTVLLISDQFFIHTHQKNGSRQRSKY
ncbi:unnamed protein product [Aphis gossypii]|uniref:Uncharacterized protein n=1 Tax=Aphis gossypii TaxID=80765 RepID=A0A9P0J2M2_APHGO|nr:unnamed protein product [Aphis gossypii]